MFLVSVPMNLILFNSKINKICLKGLYPNPHHFTVQGCKACSDINILSQKVFYCYVFIPLSMIWDKTTQIVAYKLHFYSIIIFGKKGKRDLRTDVMTEDSVF